MSILYLCVKMKNICAVTVDRLPEPLELDLHIVVYHHVGA